MKLSARDIASFLKSPATRSQAVLLYGPDQGLISERAAQMRSTILGENYDPLNIAELNAEQVKEDPALLLDELSSLSLMGGDRLVILRDAADAAGKVLEQALAEIANPTAYLIIIAGDLPPRSTLRKLFEAGKNLAALPCYHDDARSLPEVIRTAFSAAGLSATPDATQYLCTQLGNDRGITQNELEKIILYMGNEKQVTLEIAQELVADNSEMALDDLSHAVASGNVTALHTAFMRHLHEAVPPVSLIRAVTRYFLKLQQAQGWIETGASPEEAAKKTRTFFKHIPAFKSHLQSWDNYRLHKAQKLLMQAERDVKHSSPLPELITSRSLIRISRMAGSR